MSPSSYSRVVLVERPKGEYQPSVFKHEVVPYNLKPGDGQVVVRVDYVSMDPAMRGWLDDTRSYVPPVAIGAVMRAGALGAVVEAGKNSKFKVGDAVSGSCGWTEYAVMKDKDLTKIGIPPNAQLLDFLGVLGFPGLTAYFGLLDVGNLKAGETLVVSGAAGAVGSAVCQIGKLKGAKVIAIAGSKDKCDWLEQELGVDKAFNYKSPTFKADFKKQVGYYDVYFDNVGGEMLNYMLTRMNKDARIALCGAISDYNTTTPFGLTSYKTLISMRAKIQGFIVFDYVDRFPTAIAELAQWLAEGKIKRKFHIVEGIKNAPEALPLLFTGGNTGKLVVKVSKESARL